MKIHHMQYKGSPLTLCQASLTQVRFFTTHSRNINFNLISNQVSQIPYYRDFIRSVTFRVITNRLQKYNVYSWPQSSVTNNYLTK